MNTLKIEALLAKKYKYKPLSKELSEKYRSYFRDNIPEWLKETGQNQPLYTNRGSIITNRYERIVVGDYGAFVEFSEPIFEGQFIIAPGQEYRVFDDRYSKNIKYEWLTIDDGSNVKIYFQKRTVNYADYKPNMYYVSVHEVYPAGGLLYELGEWDMFELITSAWYGKQYYFLDQDGYVYSRLSHTSMEKEKAVQEFITAIGLL